MRLSHEEEREAVEKMLVETGLADKRKAQSTTLSGGMKRKLSVGIALTGGSKVPLHVLYVIRL